MLTAHRDYLIFLQSVRALSKQLFVGFLNLHKGQTQVLAKMGQTDADSTVSEIGKSLATTAWQVKVRRTRTDTGGHPLSFNLSSPPKYQLIM